MRSLPADLKLAVVGHLEWVTFLAVNELPSPGQISRAHRSLEEPAGAGAVVAVQLARLTGQKVAFFTALGKDEIGARSEARLRELGVTPIIAWRDQPTRRGISLVDRSSDRAITVIGERLTPIAADPLPWEHLADCAGVFVSATDPQGLKLARAAKVLTATPRLRLPVLQEAKVSLDALIGSHLDPGECIEEGALTPAPCLRIATEGERGGSFSQEDDLKPNLCLAPLRKPTDAAIALQLESQQDSPQDGQRRTPSSLGPSAERPAQHTSGLTPEPKTLRQSGVGDALIYA